MLRFKERIFYGWVMVATLFVVGMTLAGIRFSFGVFFKSIESGFDLTRASTSAVFSLYMVLGGIFAIICGWALDRYGPKIVILLMGISAGLSLVLTSQTSSLWQLFITYSLLAAVGTGAAVGMVMSTVSRWFDKKRGLALGIATSGQGMGMIVIAPLATYLISEFGWRMTYLIMGLGTWFVVVPLSRLLKRDPHEIGALPDGANSELKPAENLTGDIRRTDFSLPQALRTKSFWLMMWSWVFLSSSALLVLTHFVPHITDLGFSAGEAAAVLSLFGGSTIAGRVLMGITSDRIGRKLASIICMLLKAGAMLWVIWAQDLWVFYLVASVCGFAFGGFSISMGALIGDTFGLSKIGAIFGTVEVAFGVGAAIGPAVGGLVYDATGNYSLAFLLAAITLLVATFLVALIRRERNVSSAGV